MKHGRRGKPHERVFWVDFDKPSQIMWGKARNTRLVTFFLSLYLDCSPSLIESPPFPFCRSPKFMYFSDILEVKKGIQTAVFEKDRRISNIDHCISLIGKQRTLDFHVSSMVERDELFSSFNFLIGFLKRNDMTPDVDAPINQTN